MPPGAAQMLTENGDIYGKIQGILDHAGRGRVRSALDLGRKAHRTTFNQLA